MGHGPGILSKGAAFTDDNLQQSWSIHGRHWSIWLRGFATQQSRSRRHWSSAETAHGTLLYCASRNATVWCGRWQQYRWHSITNSGRDCAPCVAVLSQNCINSRNYNVTNFSFWQQNAEFITTYKALRDQLLLTQANVLAMVSYFSSTNCHSMCSAAHQIYRILIPTVLKWKSCSTLSGTHQSRHKFAGVYVGCMYQEYLDVQVAANPKVTPQGVVGNGLSFMVGRLSYTFNFSGACVSTDTACSSSLVSVDLANKVPPVIYLLLHITTMFKTIPMCFSRFFTQNRNIKTISLWTVRQLGLWSVQSTNFVSDWQN